MLQTRALRDVVHPTYLRALVRRGVLLWLVCRIILIGIGAASRVGFGLALSPLVIVLLALAVAGLAHEDARVMRERLFYANLGTASWWPAAVAALCVIVLEAIITMLAIAVESAT